MTTEEAWQRRWKREFKAIPWLEFMIDGERYLVKSRFQSASYEFMLTDLTSFWFESMDEDSLKKRTKKLNPSIEAPLEKLLLHIQQNVSEYKKSMKYSVSFKDTEDPDQRRMMFSIDTQLAGLPFIWKFIGHPADPELISEHMTTPLLMMIGELQRRERELYRLLLNKDKEIADYRAQGVRTSRKHLETTAFDDSVFNSSMAKSPGLTAVVNQQGFGAFYEAGQILYKDLMRKHCYLEREPSEAMEGESLADEESADAAVNDGTSWGTGRLPGSLVPDSRSPSVSPNVTPKTSPTKRPAESPSPAKDTEFLRRQALERKLEEDAEKKEQKQAKKKKKMKF